MDKKSQLLLCCYRSLDQLLLVAVPLHLCVVLLLAGRDLLQEMFQRPGTAAGCRRPRAVARPLDGALVRGPGPAALPDDVATAAPAPAAPASRSEAREGAPQAEPD